MNNEQAYQWLHGDRTEYSGCRAAAEAMEAEIKRLRDALKLAESYIAPRVQHTHGHGETQVLPVIRAALAVDA
jgi:hypothetical protein